MWASGRDGALAQLAVGQPAALQGQGGAPEIQERGEDNALVGLERGDGAFGDRGHGLSLPDRGGAVTFPERFVPTVSLSLAGQLRRRPGALELRVRRGPARGAGADLRIGTGRAGDQPGPGTARQPHAPGPERAGRWPTRCLSWGPPCRWPWWGPCWRSADRAIPSDGCCSGSSSAARPRTSTSSLITGCITGHCPWAGWRWSSWRPGRCCWCSSLCCYGSSLTGRCPQAGGGARPRSWWPAG